MGRIRGHYEWDNDDLTPGQKKEGGLHQNLFDSDGNLKGSARFIPDDGRRDEPLLVTETVYVPIVERRKSREQEELEEVIAALVGRLIDIGIAKAKPVVSQWYRTTVRPALNAQASKVAGLRKRRLAPKAPVEAEAVVEQSQAVAETRDETRPRMSKAEAQARYLASLAAHAYSDEQMRLVMGADIVDGHGETVDELERSLAELPSAEVRALLKRMATDPSMLSEATLAELASLLGSLGRGGPDEPRRLS